MASTQFWALLSSRPPVSVFHTSELLLHTQSRCGHTETSIGHLAPCTWSHWIIHCSDGSLIDQCHSLVTWEHYTRNHLDALKALHLGKELPLRGSCPSSISFRVLRGGQLPRSCMGQLERFALRKPHSGPGATGEQPWSDVSMEGGSLSPGQHFCRSCCGFW